MCGIVGILSNDKTKILNKALYILEELEYRGYDSAGVAIINDDNKILARKEIGQINNLKKIIDSSFDSTIAIGHTRWATHGAVCVENCHPHCTDKVAVVHNGIIENYKHIKNKLLAKGYNFKSQTDSETIAVLIDYYISQNNSFETAVKKTIKELKGKFAFIAIGVENGHKIMSFAKQGSPLVLSKDINNNFYISSDINVLAMYVNEYYIMEDGDYGFLRENVKIFNSNANKEISIKFQKIKTENKNLSTSNKQFETIMLKEINEQPEIIKRLYSTYISINKDKVKFLLPKFNFSLKKTKEINIVACGSSYYAGFLAKHYLEKYANINVNCFIASEFLYGNYNFKKNGVFLFISQSGETADSIACLKLAKKHKQKIISIVNVKNSTIDSLSDTTMYCYAGTEKSVASTKAFISQVNIMIIMSLYIGFLKHTICKKKIIDIVNDCNIDNNKLEQIIQNSNNIKEIANKIKDYDNIIITGRNISYCISLEGALKIKEITYINTNAISAGELKHGTISLITDKSLVIAVAINDNTFSKTCSNIEEIIARKGKVILISDKNGIEYFKNNLFDSIELPSSNPFFVINLYIATLQLLAYNIAKILNRNIDKPRNLAKSVTVE